RGAGCEQELAAVLEHEGDRAFLAQIATVLAERMAHFGHSADAIVGHAIDDHGSTTHAIALVADFLVVGAIGPARAALDGALDVFLGHVGCRALVPCHAQARIGVGVGAAGAGGNRDFTNDFCPELASFSVLATFSVLDVRPFTVTGHKVSSIKDKEPILPVQSRGRRITLGLPFSPYPE